MRKRIVKAERLILVVGLLLIFGFLTLALVEPPNDEEIRQVYIEIGVDIVFAALLIFFYHTTPIARTLRALDAADDPTIQQLEEKLAQISQQLEALQALVAGNGPGLHTVNKSTSSTQGMGE